jgi:[1-hydroxy-2-(trimethylamino)ethyl]phosphonate dioxygenase
MSLASVNDLLALYARWGNCQYDEEISQLAHALQTAALASVAGAPDPLVAAALLHDVGHLLHLEMTRGSPGDIAEDQRHEATGARHLAALFPAEVTGPVALHVRAKRYLCAIDVTYAGALSDGSRRSLRRQGGPMEADEIASFEAASGSRAAVALRRWDDQAKVDGLDVAPLERYDDLLRRVSAQPDSSARRES